MEIILLLVAVITTLPVENIRRLMAARTTLQVEKRLLFMAGMKSPAVPPLVFALLLAAPRNLFCYLCYGLSFR